MGFSDILNIIQSVLELGLIGSLTVLALFLSYSMLNVCDLSTDGCFTLGAAVGAVVALSGHPYLAIPAAMAAGVCSGFVTAFLQTRMGINSLLSGIIVNTGLYSVNIAVLGGASLKNLNNVETVFTKMKALLSGTFLNGWHKVIVAFIAVALAVVFMSVFLKTRLGLAIRATGDNTEMVRYSSINPVFTTTVGLCVANAFTALSGCLLAQTQKLADINMGQGMVTVALASLLIGGTLFSRGSIKVRAVGAVVGGVIFRLVYAIALRFQMPAYMLKLVSAVIVIFAIFIPYLKKQYPALSKRLFRRKEA
ncbi:MAG: ABC transporter permease [Clostridia bacterium]|nr:ABC transporter permease [Clostridia bacterium]